MRSVPVVGGGGGVGHKILTHFRNQTKQPPIVDKQTYPNPNQNKNQSQPIDANKSEIMKILIFICKQVYISVQAGAMWVGVTGDFISKSVWVLEGRGRRREKHQTVGGGTVGRRPRVATPIWVGAGISGSRRNGWGREMR